MSSAVETANGGVAGQQTLAGPVGAGAGVAGQPGNQASGQPQPQVFQAGGHLVLAQASGQQPAASAVDTLTVGATGPDGRPICCEDIQKVQNLIETCLQLYMSQAEVVNTLKSEASVQPRFTTLVWQKLEEQNPEFFRAYYTRLKLKDQIVLFNHLLEQQVQMFQKLRSGWMQPGHPQLIAQRPHMGGQVQLQAMPGPFAGAPLHVQPMPGQPQVPQGQGVPQAVAMHAVAPGPGAADGGQVSPGMGAGRGVMPQPPQPASQAEQQQQQQQQEHFAAVSGQMMQANRPVGMEFSQPPASSGAMAQYGGLHTELDYQISMSAPELGVLQGLGGPNIGNGLHPHQHVDPHAELSGLPRNFSLSDLNLDIHGHITNDSEDGLGMYPSMGGEPTDDMPGYDLGIDLEG